MKGNEMEIIYASCIIVLTICGSVTLLSFAKKNFATIKAMDTIGILVDIYKSVFEKSLELFDQMIKGEPY